MVPGDLVDKRKPDAFNVTGEKLRNKIEKMARNSPIAIRAAEKFLLALGLILLGFYVAARIHGVVVLHAAVRGFEESKTTGVTLGCPPEKAIDFTLWSPKRVQHHKKSLAKCSDRPLALLKIPKLHLVAPVWDGLDDLSLNAGVGWIPGTVRPGQVGNIGIAGHRDGFFRGLEEIHDGDKIELELAGRTDAYVVAKAFKTAPTDTKVLTFTKEDNKPKLTLVTCYPFRHYGLSSERWVVQAVRQ